MGIIRSDYLPTDTPTQKAVAHQTTDGQTVVHQQNDVSGILRMNHFLKSTQPMLHGNEIMNHYANVDVLALKNWCAARGITKRWWQQLFEDDSKLLRTFLNDPENKCWRTRSGKV